VIREARNQWDRQTARVRLFTAGARSRGFRDRRPGGSSRRANREREERSSGQGRHNVWRWSEGGRATTPAAAGVASTWGGPRALRSIRRGRVGPGARLRGSRDVTLGYRDPPREWNKSFVTEMIGGASQWPANFPSRSEGNKGRGG